MADTLASHQDPGTHTCATPQNTHVERQRTVNPGYSQRWDRMDRLITVSSKRIQKGTCKTSTWSSTCKGHWCEQDCSWCPWHHCKECWPDCLNTCFGASVLDRLLEYLHTQPQCLTALQVAWMHTSWCLHRVLRTHMWMNDIWFVSGFDFTIKSPSPPTESGIDICYTVNTVLQKFLCYFWKFRPYGFMVLSDLQNLIFLCLFEFTKWFIFK